MSIKPVKPAETPAEVRPDHFPQPNTIPNGWDLSGLMSVYNPASFDSIDMKRGNPVSYENDEMKRGNPVSLESIKMKRGNPAEMVEEPGSVPLDFGVSAELTEKYSL